MWQTFGRRTYADVEQLFQLERACATQRNNVARQRHSDKSVFLSMIQVPVRAETDVDESRKLYCLMKFVSVTDPYANYTYPHIEYNTYHSNNTTWYPGTLEQ